MRAIASVRDFNLCVGFNVRRLGVYYTNVFVKVEQQRWLENKCTRGIAVTRYT